MAEIKTSLLLGSLLFLASQLLTSTAITSGTDDGMEKWGYVDVREGAHIFWCYYKSPQWVSAPGKPWPTILWLHGGPPASGPGGSGVGQGNLEEIGPLDNNLNPRKTTWLRKADLIFIDSPAGVGFSYVDDASALASTDEQAANDIVKVIDALTKEIPTLQSSPLYLVGVSYGGRHAAMVARSLGSYIRAGSLNLTKGGVVLDGAWISPADFAVSSPVLLHTVSRLTDNAMPKAMGLATRIQQQVAAAQYLAAYETFDDLYTLINEESGQVNLENFMLDNPTPEGGVPGPNRTSDVMNRFMREKYKIIPKNVTWQVSLEAFEALKPNFMKPVINVVDDLLMDGWNVTVYNGQLNLITSTIGAEMWVRKLRWDGLPIFLDLPRIGLNYCPPIYQTNAFVRSYKNLHFYWVLGAGYRVVDQPCTALHMIGDIVGAK